MGLWFAALALLATTNAAADNDDDGLLKDMDQTGANTAELAEKLGARFSSVYFSNHGADPHAYFEHYNRFKDGTVQTLGPQEVRELLKDLELGPYALRGEYASALTQALDADEDGRVSEVELTAALNVVTCYVDGSASPLAKAHALSALIEAVTAPKGFRALVVELQRCTPLEALWRMHRLRAVHAESRLNEALGLDRALPPAECTAAIVAPVTKATRGTGGAGAGALRRALKTEGVEPLLLRHLVALATLHALDRVGPADGRLSDAELGRFTEPLCELYETMRRLGASAVAAAESLLYGARWNAVRFLDAIDALGAGDAHEQAKLTLAQGSSSPGDAMAVAVAYLSLAPDGAFEAFSSSAKDEV